MALTDENHLNSPIALSTGQKTHTPTTDHHTTNRRRPLGPLPSPSPAVQFSPAASLEVSSPLLLPIFDVRVMAVDSGAASVQRWYNVRLVCRLRPDLSWRVTRRYSEFDALAVAIKRNNAVHMLVPSLPPKLPSLLLSAAELQRRVIGLQRWSQHVLASTVLLGDPEVATFFDLSFGLWYVRDNVATRGTLLDPAQQRAAALIAAHIRRRREQRKLAMAVRAAIELQAAGRRLINVQRERQARDRAWTAASIVAAMGTRDDDMRLGTSSALVPLSSTQSALVPSAMGYSAAKTAQPTSAAFGRRMTAAARAAAATTSRKRSHAAGVHIFEGVQAVLGWRTARQV